MDHLLSRSRANSESRLDDPYYTSYYTSGLSFMPMALRCVTFILILRPPNTAESDHLSPHPHQPFKGGEAELETHDTPDRLMAKCFQFFVL